MLIKTDTQDLLHIVCLFQDIIEFCDGWFISIKPDVCIEVFFIVGGVAMAMSSEPRVPERIWPQSHCEMCKEPAPLSAPQSAFTE